MKLWGHASSQIVALSQSFSTIIKLLSFDRDKAVWLWLEDPFFFYDSGGNDDDHDHNDYHDDDHDIDNSNESFV